MSDVTRILSAIEQGDPKAAEQLLPLVYDELRKLAATRPAREALRQSLQATALVHEAYLRLVGPDPDRPFDGPGHFLAAAAEAMRRILVDRARLCKRLKRGCGRRRARLDLDNLLAEPPGDDMLALAETLTAMSREDPEVAELVKPEQPTAGRHRVRSLFPRACLLGRHKTRHCPSVAGERGDQRNPHLAVRSGPGRDSPKTAPAPQSETVRAHRDNPDVRCRVPGLRAAARAAISPVGPVELFCAP
jgi:RNA polymerase sigma factor (TIGR02999 family)